MDPSRIFKDVSKIPIVGEIIIGVAIYLVLSVIAGTTNFFQLDPTYQPWIQKLFLAISLLYISLSLGIRAWKYFQR